jgi:orotate phosphoribosyltransferase
MWDREKFYDFIIKNNVIGFFKEPLKLKSGRKSYWYVNWRNVAEDVFLLDELTNFVISYVEDIGLKPDLFYGVPEGATKLGVITQFKWAKNQKDYSPHQYNLSMGRGKPKEHGDPKDKFFLGVPKGHIILLEDVTTTGGSLLETIDNLKELNIKIDAAIGLTNRNELRDDGKSVEDAVKDKGVKYTAMSDALDLLPRLNPESDIARHVEDYFQKYGMRNIKFM